MSCGVWFSRNRESVVEKKSKGPKSKFRNTLLAGTALVGAMFVPGMPRAATITLTNGENRTDPINLTSDTNLQTVSGGTEAAEQSGNINTSSDSSPHTLTVNPIDFFDSITISGLISGSGALVKTGSGRVYLSGSNTFTGGTTINMGFLELQNENGLGSGTLTFGGGGLVLDGVDLSNDIDLIGGNGQINVNTYQGVVTISSNVNTSADMSPHSINFANPGFMGTLNISGIISGSGSVMYSGLPNTNRITNISGSNTYTGGTTISSGVVRPVNNNAFGTGDITTAGQGNFNDAATIELGNGITVPNNIDLTRNTRLTTISGGTETAEFSGDITQSDSAAVVLFATPYDANDTLTLSGNISGSYNLGMDGAGTLILSGTNSFSGLTIDSGIVQLENNSAVGGGVKFNGGALALGDGLTISNLLFFQNGDSGTLQTISGGTEVSTVTGNLNLAGTETLTIDTFDPSDLLTLSGVILGTAKINKTGSGTLVLSGSNTFTGGTIISEGTVQANNNAAFGTGMITFEAGTSSNLNLSNGINIANGFQLDGTGTITPLGGGTATLSGILAGAGSLIKNGSGTLVLSGSNTYTGGTTIDGGTLRLLNDSALGTGDLTILGSTVEFGDGVNISNVVNLESATTFSTLSGGTETAEQSGDIDTSSDGSPHTLTINPIDFFDSITISGLISGSGGLAKTGSGILTLSGSNTFSGGIVIDSGQLRTLNDNALGSGTVTLRGGTLRTEGANISNDINISGANSFISRASAGATPTTLSGNINTSADGNPNVVAIGITSVGVFNITGTISGSGGVLYTGGSNVGAYFAVSGSNTYTGGTGFSQGRVRVLNDNAFGTGDIILDGQNAFVNMPIIELADGINLSNNIGSISNAGLNTIAGGTETAVFSGNIYLQEANVNLISLNAVDSGDTLTLSGVLSGGLTFGKRGSGTVVLSGSNTFTGGFYLSSGTLQLENDSALGTGSVGFFGGALALTNGLTIDNNFYNNGGGYEGTIQSLSGGTEIATLTGNFILSGTEPLTFNPFDIADQITVSGNILGSASLLKTGSGTLVLSGSNSYTGGTTVSAGILQGNTLSLQGNILNNSTLIFSQTSAGTYSGVISGSGNLVKNGTNNLVLSGSNTFTGSTTVNAGVLNVTGSTVSNTNVGAGATLMGTGTVGGIDLSGTVAPGASIGTLTVTNDVTFNSGSVFEVEANDAGASDLLMVTGSVTINANATVDVQLLPGTFTTGQTYTVLTSGGTITGSFTTVNSNISFIDISQTVTANSVVLELTVNALANIYDEPTYASGVGIANAYGADGALSFDPSVTINLTGNATAFNLGSNTIMLIGNDSVINGNGFTALELDSGTLSLENLDINGLVQVDGGGLILNTDTTFADLSGAGGTTLNLQSNLLTINGAGTTTFAGNISGSGGLNKSGSGNLTLSGSNTFTGSSTLTAGTLQLSGGSAFGDSTTLNIEGGTLQLNASEAIGNLFGSGGMIALGSNTLTVNQSASGAFSGTISGSGGLNKQGTKTLTLSGSNTYTGGTIINGGTLRLLNSAAAGNGTITVNGSSIELGNGVNNANAVDMYADTTLSTLSDGSEIAEQSGNINTSADSATHTLTLKTYNYDFLTVSGAISGSGDVVVNNLGSGAVILSGSNTYSGGTTLNGGTLELLNSNALGSGALNILGSTVSLGNAVNISNSINLNNSATILTSDGASTAAEVSGNINTGAGNDLDVQAVAPGHQLTLSGNISGSGGLDFNGFGTIVLSGSNTFTGGTLLDNATLVLSGGSALSDSGTVIIEGGTLQLNANEAIGTLWGMGGIIDLQSNTLTINQVTNNLSHSGTIVGSGSVIKAGTKALTLSGSNTFSGGLEIQNGMITLANNAGAGTGLITLAGGDLQIQNGLAISNSVALTQNGDLLTVSGGTEIAALSGTVNTGGFQLGVNTYDAVDVFTLSGLISGSGAVSKTGSGVLVLSGSNTYTGGTTINGGTLRLLNSAGAGSGTITVNGSSIELGNGVNNANAIDMNADTGLSTLTGGTESAEQSGNINTSADSATHTLTASAVDASDTLTISGAISGSGALNVTGLGNVILSNTNTFTGGTTLTSGTLQLSGGSALLDTGTLQINGGVLQLNASETVGALSGSGGGIALGSNTLTVNQNNAGNFAGDISGSGSLVKNGTKALTLSGTNTFGGGTTLNAGTLILAGGSALSDSGAVVITGGSLQLNASEAIGMLSGSGGGINLGSSTLTVNQNGTGTFAGVISGSGDLVKNGSGKLTLSGNNTFSGNFQLNNGDVQVMANNALGVGTFTFNNAGSSLIFDDTNVSLANDFALMTNGLITSNSGVTGLHTFTGNFDLMSNTLTFNGSFLSNQYDVQGVVSGSGGIFAQGGTLFLSGSNTFSGGLAISDGFVYLDNDTAAGTGTINFTTSALGGILELGTTGGITVSNDIVVANGVLPVISVDGGFTSTLTGNITLGDSGLSGLYLWPDGASDTLIVSGNISGGKPIIKEGSGTLVLSGNNTQVEMPSGGSLQILDGKVVAQSNTALGGGFVQFNGSGDETLELDNVSVSNAVDANSDFTVKTVSGGSDTSTIAGNINLNGNGATANVVDSSDTLIISGNISGGSGSLDKTGSGTLVLSGTNTFTGGTMVTGGTLDLQGSLAGTTTVGSNGTLIGTGTLTNLVSNGTVAPGNSIGTLNITGDASLNSGTTLDIDLEGTGASDLLMVAGTVTIDPGATVNATLLPGQFTEGQTFSIITSGSGIVGTFGSISSNLSFVDLGLTYNANSVTVTIDAINALALIYDEPTYTTAVGLANASLMDGALEFQNSVTVSLTGDASAFDLGTKTFLLRGNNATVDGNGFTTLQLDSGTLVVEALTLNGEVQLNGGTFGLGTDIAIGDLGGAAGANVDLQSNTLTINQAGSSTFAGTIFGSGGIVKNGSGQLTLSGSNTFSGGTTLASGTLVLMGGSALSDSGALTINGGTLQLGASEAVGMLSGSGGAIALGSNTLTVNQDGNGTFAGTISGSGSLYKSGSAVLGLSGSNTFTGGITINGGTLRLLSSGAAGAGNITVLGSTVELGDGVNNGANIDMMADTTLGTIAGGTETAEQSGGVNTSADASPHTLTVDAVDGGDSLNLSGVVSGSGSLVKVGSGVVTLSGANTFSGGTTVTSGTLALAGGAALSDSGTVAVNGGSLQLNASEAIGTLSGSGGGINLGSNTLTVNQGANASYSGVVSGSGSLNKQGSGTLNLSNTNTFSGTTIIGGGTLQADNAMALGTSTLDLAGGTLAINNVNLANAVSLSDDSTISTIAGGTEASGLSGAIDLGTSTLTANVIEAADSLNFSGVISGSGAFEKTGSGSATLSGSNTFTGGTTLTSGTLILSGGAALSDSGAVAVNGGTLQLNASEGVGALSGSGGAIALGSSTLTVNQAGSSTFAGAINGTGGLVKAGSGVLALSGTNTYTGGTTISGGTLRLLNSAAAGSNTVTITGSSLELGDGVTHANAVDLEADATLGTVSGGSETAEQSGNVNTSADASAHVLNANAVDAGDQLTISGVVSGSGSLNKTGQGTVILNNSNTFTGGTTVTSGTLQLSGGAALNDSGTVAVNGGTLQLNASEAFGALSGSGGTVALGSNTLTVNQGTNGTFAGAFTGSGVVMKNGTGVLSLSGNSTFTGGLTIADGQVSLLSNTGGGAGAITFNGSGDEVLGLNGVIIANDIDVTTAGQVASTGASTVNGSVDTMGNTLTLNTANGSDSLTLGGVISGTGSLVKTGSGTLSLAAANTFTGGVDLQSGTLFLGDDDAAGTGAVAVNGTGTAIQFGDVDVGNGINLNVDGMIKLSGATAIYSGILNGGSNTLTANTVNGSDTLTFNNVFNNLGTFTKVGDGTVIFTGSDKTIGTTNVNEGTLINNTNLMTSLNIVNGASYGGNGTLIGDLMITGTLSPGNSIGTTVVVGDVTFESNSTFIVEVDNMGNSDMLDVTGMVTINGGTLAILPEAGTYGVSTDYTVITTTGGVTGDFNEITSALSFLDPSYEIVGNELIVTLDLISVAQFATTPNQMAVAGIVDPLLQGTPSDDFVNVINQLFSNSATIPQNLDQLSGEGFGTLTSSTLATTNLRVQGIAGHLNNARLCQANPDATCDTSGLASAGVATRYAQAGANAGPTQSEEWGNGTLWMQGYGGKATMDNGGGKFNSLGFDIGYDRWVSDNILIGLSAGYARDRENGFANLATGESSFVNVGVHTAMDFDGAYFTGLLNFGFGDYDTTRNIAFGTINRTATANFNGTTISGYGELGYDGHSGNVNIQPFAALQYSNVKRDAFTETGASSIDLVVNQETVNSVQGSLGLRVSTVMEGSNGLIIKPEFRARYVHEFGDAGDPRNSVVNFNGSTAPFATIANPAGFSDAFIFGGGFDFSRGGALRIVVGADFLISDEYDMWSGTGRLIWAF